MNEHLAAILFEVAARTPEAPALGRRVAGQWVTQSFEELAVAVRRLTNALVHERLLPAETAVIMAPAGPSWFLAHFALLAAGGVVVPVDETSSAEETAAVIRETEARIVLVGGERAHETIARIRPRLPSLRLVVALDDPGTARPVGTDAVPAAVTDGDRPAGRHRPGAPEPHPTTRTTSRRASRRDLKAVVALGRLEQLPYDVATAAEARRRQESWSGDDIAAVHYLPSPAGVMRGAVVTHAASLYPLHAIIEVLPLPEPPTMVLSLPITQPLPYWAALAVLLDGGTLWTLEPGADVASAHRELRPSIAVTTVAAAQELVDDVREQVRSRLSVSPELEDWALRTAAETDALTAAGRHPTPALALARRAADLRVFGPMRTRLGGPRALTLLAGQSMPSPELTTWLRLLDQAPLVGWGTRETCALATINRPGEVRAGSVGPPLPGTQVRIADSGEVLVRGPGIMRGYYGRPAETRATLVDGWLYSGQSGRLDEDGHLYLTSRVDDIIALSSLQYISPRPLERALEEDPLVAEAVVIGDGRPALTVLIHPELAALREHLGRAAPTGDGALLGDPRAVRAVGDVVRRLNESGAGERLRAFRLVLAPLGPSSAMTGSALTRRQRALQDHADVIDAMYASLETTRRPGKGA